jgi:prepilin-type N-terminal cleavage/methylation domain-containing protein
MRSRSGFTLVELLVSLILFVLVGGSIYQVLNVSQRSARTATERGAMQGGLRTGIQVAISELQELWTDSDAGTSAITGMTPTKVTYYGMRGLGFTCSDTDEAQIKVRRSSYSDARGSNPDDTDRLWVFADNDENDDEDDEWLLATINAAPSAGNCDDGEDAILIVIAGLGGKSGRVLDPAPIRTDKEMELGLVTVDGRDWLGIAEAAGEELTPLAGPLVTNGLLFEYKNATGPAASVSDVRSIIMTLQAETDRAANRGISSQTKLLSDTVQVRVQLRNGR